MSLPPPGGEHRDAGRVLFRVGVVRVAWVIIDTCRPPFSPLSNPMVTGHCRSHVRDTGRADISGRNGNRLPTTRTSASPAGQPTIGMKSRPRQLGSRHGLGPATAGALVGAGRDLISGMGASGGRPVRPGRLCECARAIGTARGGMRSLATSCEDLPQTTIASANRRIEDLTLATRRKCCETTMAVDQVRKRCWGDRRHRSW